MKEKLEAILQRITDGYDCECETELQEIRELFALMVEQVEEFREAARQAEKIAEHWQAEGKMLQAKLGEAE